MTIELTSQVPFTPPHAFFPFPEIRPSQQRALDAWTNAMLKDKRFAVFELPTGAGKCFAPGTPVLMFDGTIRAVETIQVGEKLMGPDSTPRTVLELSHGQDEMFRVTPTKGMPFVVNSTHVLSLQMTPGSGYLTGRSSGQHGPKHPSRPTSVVNIPVHDYLKKPAYWKHCAKAYRVGVEFPEQAVPVDPYFIGLWLGDGSKDRAEVTTMDLEVEDYVYALASGYDLQVTRRSNGSKATGLSISSQVRGGDPSRNPVRAALRELNLLNNKHIPQCFMVNSREVRLSLLAGYLDADGSLSRGGFDYTSELEGLANDIAFLARSLGLAAYVVPCTKKDQHGISGNYFRGSISGDTTVIPTKIQRKKSGIRRQIKSVLRSGIKVTPVGVGDYYGFSVDGDHLFLLGDFTVTHNSPLAVAIGTWAEHAAMKDTDEHHYQHGAYILTTQKSLQQQYMRDFSSLGVMELRGAGNYRCSTHGTDCSTGADLNRSNKALLRAKKNHLDPDYAKFVHEHPCECIACPYREAKADFIDAPLGVTNFSYLLAEANHVGVLPPRSLLVIDEAHNTESQILNFVNLEITKGRCEKIGCQRPPEIKNGDTKTARDWCLTVFAPILEMKIRETQDACDRESDQEARKYMLASIRGMSQYIMRLSVLKDLTSFDEWFACTDDKTGALRLRPLTARTIAEEYLFRMGHKILFLSATILDGNSFIRGLGLSGPQGGFLRVESDFPVENRLVHIWPAGSMSYKKKEQTTPRLVRYIEKVLDRHPEEKGLIHTNSYALNRDVLDYLEGTPHKARLITHSNLQGEREAAIRRHLESPEPTVLISPSMTEGLDLSEDLSRFQILSKVPYPYLGDPFVKARMAHDHSWMTWQTALALVQATGRSIRSKTDHATTYIIDSDVERFLCEATSILPEWWKQALVYH